MLRYKIIKDEKKLSEFVDILPDTTPDERLYVTLFARKKYAPESGMTNDKQQLKRFVSDKQRLIQKIKQLEVPFGAYTFGKEDKPVPQESLALYITPNPRSLKKAGAKVAKDLFDRLLKGEVVNPQASSMNALQTEFSRKIWYCFDIDYANNDSYNKTSYGRILKEWIQERVGYTCDVTMIETRGGYHILVKMDTIEKTYQKTWYGSIVNHDWLDMKGDLLVPVPGCCQGGFIPRIV